MSLDNGVFTRSPFRSDVGEFVLMGSLHKVHSDVGEFVIMGSLHEVRSDMGL